VTDPICWLTDPQATDPREVGTKAAQLARLLQAGFPVPPGFCLTRTAYTDFLETNGLIPVLAAFLDQVRCVSSDLLGPAIRDLQERFLAGDLSPGLQRRLATAVADLLRQWGEARLAVRSSATAEDLPAASFAGVQETFLDVPPDHLATAIKRCWASLWSARALLYRDRQGIAHDDVTIAVLVQPLIPCTVSGVAFSQDPLHPGDRLVIEATWGLGQGLVQGELVPDRYTVDRRTGQEIPPVVISRKRAKRVATGAGTRLVPTAPHEELARTLTPQQVRRIAALARAVEDHTGLPQDIEWGLNDAALYLLQARPITTPPARDFFTEEIPGDTFWWTSGFVNERFPHPVSPLGWSLLRPLLEELAFRDPLRFLGYPAAERLPVTKLFQGHPYVNVTVFQIIYRLFPAALLPEDAQRYFPPGEGHGRRLAPYPSWRDLPRVAAALLRSLWRTRWTWSPLHNIADWERFIPRYRAILTDCQSRSAATESPADCLDLVNRLQAANAHLLAIHRWTLTHADLFFTALRRLLQRWLPDLAAETLGALLADLDDLSVHLDRDLAALADLVRQDPTLEALLRHNGRALLSPDPPTPAAARFRAHLDQFLQRYGHRSFSLDILWPTFGDDPEQVLRLVRLLLDREVSPPTTTGRPREARAMIRQKMRPRPLERWLGLRQRLLDWLITQTRRYLRARENQRFYWQMGLHAQRRLFWRLGQLWTDQGVLPTPEDIFFLTFDEIAQAVASGQTADLGPTAARRRRQFEHLWADYERFPQHSYPPFLKGSHPLTAGVGASPNGCLRGRGASPGLRRGRVRIVTHPRFLERVERGDILVAPSTDPAWTPVFGKIAGLVVENGGLLSHGSVVAREYGIPAVVGVPAATRLLREGELVLVNGTVGEIIRLEGG